MTNRQDLHEAVDFAVRGLVKAQVSMTTFDEINSIVEAIRQGTVMGRKVLKIARTRRHGNE